MELKISILNLLKKNCTYTYQEIAKMLNTTEEEVKKTIKELEESGAIIKYCALVNEEVVNKKQIAAIIEVKITPESGKGFDAIAEKICQFKEVTNCMLVSGSFDLIVTVEGTDAKEIALFVAEKLATIKGILSTNTHFLLRKYKIEGEKVFKKNNSKRLAITP
ncbi:MAG TPA: Lrp/AsnC family transcriptional regulator [bacterium]|mgnify:CR=1 FL=1|nr:Lrp/AsnC family transcriptional regulator [bacterium]HOL47979.1 Lrp/AsnC family transcriptional regulator [bacterium]HPQ19209.1 Lrp/AsnC family transcriptional regulator [bacterium]